MLEQLRRALRATFSFTNSLLGATFGLFLYPLARLYRLAIMAIILGGLAAIFIPILAAAAGYYANSALNLGLMSTILTSVITATALTGLLIGVFPVLVAYGALRILITSPIEGVRKGWNDGLFSLLANVFRMVFGRDEQVQNGNEPPNTTQNILGLLGLHGLDYNAMLQQLADQAANAARQPMTAEEYAALQLSPVEIAALRANRQLPLTEAELLKLEPSTEQKAKIVALKARVGRGEALSTTDANVLKADEELESYKNLQRLKTDDCSILASRPEREDTIVLVKQYKVGQQWLPVPGVANIYDKNGLKTWFVGEGETRGNAVNPNNQENVQRPNPHTVDGIEHETRYVYHPFYAADNSEEGLSQELNMLTPILRARARLLPEYGAGFDLDESRDDDARRFGFGAR